MCKQATICCALLFLILLTHVTVAQSTKPAVLSPAALQAKVDAILRGLDADEYAVRESATAAIPELPDSALPLLEAKLKSGSLSDEARPRLQEGIDAIHSRIGQKGANDSDVRDKEWASKMYLEGYEKSGHKDAKWDDAAKEGLSRWAKGLGGAGDVFARAVEAGCDDPLVRFMNIVTHPDMAKPVVSPKKPTEKKPPEKKPAKKEPAEKKPPKKDLSDFDTAYAGVKDGNYGGYVAMSCAIDACVVQFRDKNWSMSNELAKSYGYLQDALAQFHDANKSYTLGQTLLDRRIIGIFDMFKKIGGSPCGHTYAGFQVLPALRASEGEDSYTYHLMRGYYYANFTVRYMPGQNEEAMAMLEVYSDRARKDFEQAWALNPGSVNVAAAAINIAANHKEMELWFTRVTAKAPEHQAMFNRKALWLRDHEGMPAALAFLRETVAKSRPGSRLPLTLVTIHLQTGKRDSLMGTQDIDPQYFRQPQVLADITAAYDRYLTSYPNDMTEHSNYARLACYAQAWKIANEQFKIIGDKPDLNVFGSRPMFDELKSQAEARGER